jgi:hypothetical protein
MAGTAIVIKGSDGGTDAVTVAPVDMTACCECKVCSPVLTWPAAMPSAPIATTAQPPTTASSLFVSFVTSTAPSGHWYSLHSESMQ